MKPKVQKTIYFCEKKNCDLPQKIFKKKNVNIGMTLWGFIKIKINAMELG